jgi:hypothetical protein
VHDVCTKRSRKILSQPSEQGRAFGWSDRHCRQQQDVACDWGEDFKRKARQGLLQVRNLLIDAIKSGRIGQHSGARHECAGLTRIFSPAGLVTARGRRPVDRQTHPTGRTHVPI